MLILRNKIYATFINKCGGVKWTNRDILCANNYVSKNDTNIYFYIQYIRRASFILSRFGLHPSFYYWYLR